jgi:cysteine-rich repeat protein
MHMVDKRLAVPGLIVVAAFLLGIMIQFAFAADVQTSLSMLVCGDGINGGGVEVCDDGINLGGYGSTTAERKCMPGCTAYDNYCGDGILQARFGEQCDDGNTIATDLCSLSCRTLAPAGSTVSGSPTVGSTPFIPGAQAGTIASETQTRVVLRGKAYPNAVVNVLLDGKIKGTALADSNADFQFISTEITPGTATFGFTAKDSNGVESVTTSVVFDVAQSAVSTVANVFFPPTIQVSERQVPKGEPLTVSGFSVPKASISSEIGGGTKTTLNATADGTGAWALRVDTSSLTDGMHTVKSYFKLDTSIQSGFGKSISFSVGEGAFADTGSADLNGDGKVNLVDFSIFLLKWQSDDIQSDFNADGTVNLGDFSIMLFNWTG